MTNLTFGIRFKLIVAFGSVVSGTLLACLIGAVAFGHVANALSEISGKSVPLMSESMQLSQSGMTLSAVLPLLANATSQEQRQLQADQAQSMINQIEVTLNARAVEDRQDIREVGLARINKLSEGTHDLDNAVEKRLDATARVYQLVLEADLSHTGINNDLVSIIERESSFFFDTTDDLLGENLEIIDSYLGIPFESLLAAVRMQSNLASLGHWLMRAESANNLVRWEQSVQASLIAMTGILSGSTLIPIEDLNEPQAYADSIATLKKEYQNLSTLLKQPDLNLAVRRSGASSSAELVLSVQSDLINALTGFADMQQFLLMLNGDELRNSTANIMPELLRNRITIQSDLLELRAEMNTLAGIIGQATFVGTRASLMAMRTRFEETSTSVVDLLENLQTVQGLIDVRERTNDLLLLATKSGGIFDQRGIVLDVEASIIDLQGNLFNDQALFVEQLVDQVRLSRENVDLSGANLMHLIEDKRLQLVMLSIVSIFVTIIIYWSVVHRSLLGRLLSTIEALRAIAAGNLDASTEVSGTDELGELARTVEVFRKNAQEAKRLHAEQLEAATQKQRESDERERMFKEHEVLEKRAEQHARQQSAADERERHAKQLQIRVDRLLDTINAISQGDLERVIDIQGDDVAGQMGHALKRLIEELRHTMLEMSSNAKSLTNAADGLSSLSDTMRSAVQENAADTSRAAELTNEVDDGVTRVASATEQMSQSIKAISRSTVDAEKVAQEAVVLSRTTDCTMKKLAESSGSIGSVVKVITSIAEQTNLLALNATIEAARAGEAGKGFAVVANEVKDLARGTAEATQEIESRIVEIQADTQTAVDAITSISQIINSINDIQASITIAVQEQSVSTQEITRSIAKTSSNTNAISGIIDNVATKAKSNQEAVERVNQASAELSTMAVDLEGLVARFKVQDANTVKHAA
ncbi:MAG: methyl-accepting chemotaxis protein [Granulosicoccus sp.]